MKDYKYQRRRPADPVIVAFVALCLAYIVVGMAWGQIATYFEF